MGGSKDADKVVEGPTRTRIVESISNDEPPKYEVPRPRTAFSAFVDHPKEFVRFLEACSGYERLKEEDRKDLYTALFEMYLRHANEASDDSEKTAWQDKAKRLVEDKDVSPFPLFNHRHYQSLRPLYAC